MDSVGRGESHCLQPFAAWPTLQESKPYKPGEELGPQHMRGSGGFSQAPHEAQEHSSLLAPSACGGEETSSLTLLGSLAGSANATDRKTENLTN